MIEHKHAAILRAIADGALLSEFEVRHTGWDQTNFGPLYNWFSHILNHPDKWEVRRKQPYITVNGFKVPKPLDVMPEPGARYFLACPPALDYFVADTWCGYETDRRVLLRGISHATKEAAIAHAKAMLGIDPSIP